MKVKEEGQRLLEIHAQLHEELIKIPETREISCQLIMEDGNVIGKPRFNPPKHEWDPDLLRKVHDHLQDIWEFFDKYSFWFDQTLMPLFSFEDRRISKKSIIFLLENDVWETDEVYGKYLIEKKEKVTSISYVRRDQKIKEFELSASDKSELKQWMYQDAIKQISDQFNFLWNKLETEIMVCIDEIYHWEPKLDLSTNYIRGQLEKTIQIVNEWPEAALLNLGRIVEIWLLVTLDSNKRNNGLMRTLIREAEIRGIINKHEVRLLDKIRRNYNDLKHKPYYKIDAQLISTMVENFNQKFKDRMREN